MYGVFTGAGMLKNPALPGVGPFLIYLLRPAPGKVQNRLRLLKKAVISMIPVTLPVCTYLKNVAEVSKLSIFNHVNFFAFS